MAEFPALPLWTDAYLGDTTHLTTIEHGAYLLLLMVAWRSKDGLLPNDDKLLARYSKLTTGQWKRIRPILEPFFSISSDGWRQGRLTDELMAVRQFSKSQSNNAKARWLKNNDSDNAAALNRQCQTDAYHTQPLNQGIGKTPLPPNSAQSNAKSQNGSGSFFQSGSGFGGLGRTWDVLEHLSLAGDNEARETAKMLHWDYNVLVEKYNAFQGEEQRKGASPPRKPDRAFNAWILSFTKRKPPS